MFRALGMMLGMLLVTGPARASRLWITYDGNTSYPEDQAWERVIYPPPAQRWLEDGALVIDSLASIYTQDYYRMTFPNGGLNPGPEEEFVVRWRLQVQQVIGYEDVGVRIASDDLWSVVFLFGYDYVLSGLETGHLATFAPAVFHTYELRSGDMRAYELRIDGDVALSGKFRYNCAFPPPRVLWADGGQGATSLTRWDFFEFGVVPEPGGCLGGAVGSLIMFASESRRRRVVAPVANHK